MMASSDDSTIAARYASALWACRWLVMSRVKERERTNFPFSWSALDWIAQLLGATDLPALWQSLGVEPQEGTVKLNDDAPLAKIRNAIMRAPLNSPRAGTDRPAAR